MADKYIHIRLGNPVAWLTADDRPAAAAMQEGVVGWEMTTNQWFVVYGHQWRTYRTPDSLAADRMADLAAKLTADHEQTLAALAATNTLLEAVRDELRAQNSVAEIEIEIPGIGAGSAYTSGDAFGTRFELEVPWTSGTITNVTLADLDDEGLSLEVVVFNQDFTGTADNSAFDVSDADLGSGKRPKIISVDLFYNFNSNQVGTATPALFFTAPEYKLYCQCVIRGAANITAGQIPRLTFTVTR